MQEYESDERAEKKTRPGIKESLMWKEEDI